MQTLFSPHTLCLYLALTALPLVLEASTTALEPSCSRADVLFLDSLDSISIATLRQRSYSYVPTLIKQLGSPKTPNDYTRHYSQDGSPPYSTFVASYLSDGLLSYARVEIPASDMPAEGYPVVLFAHGWVSTKYTPKLNLNAVNLSAHSQGGDIALTAIAISCKGSSINNIIKAASIGSGNIPDRFTQAEPFGPMSSSLQAFMSADGKWTAIGGFFVTEFLTEPLSLHFSDRDYYSIPAWNNNLTKRINLKDGEATAFIYPGNTHSLKLSKNRWLSPQGSLEGFPYAPKRDLLLFSGEDPKQTQHL